MHISAQDVIEKHIENQQLRKLQEKKVKKIIKKTRIKLREEKQKLFNDRKAKIERLAFLKGIERYRASIQAKKGSKLLAQLVSRKKPIQNKPKIQYDVIYPDSKLNDLRRNAEDLIKRTVHPDEIALQELKNVKTRTERGRLALSHVKRQKVII